MSSSPLPAKPFRVWPLRARRASFEQEQAALAELQTLLGAAVERASTPQAADALLLCSGGVEPDCVRLIQSGASRVLLAGPGNNAFAAGAEVVAYARAAGSFVRLQPLAAGCEAPLQAWLLGQRAVRSLREARIGVLGSCCPWLVGPSPQPGLLAERFGLELVSMSWGELSERLGGDFATRRVGAAQHWSATPRDAVIRTADLRRAMGFSTALTQVARDCRFDALALECFGAIDRYHISGCLALADLIDLGIPAACEADSNSAFGMLLALRATGAPSWMANLSFAADPRHISLSHCSFPSSMAAESHLRTHFETGEGVAHAARLALGQEVTVWRLNWGDNTAVVLRGRVEDGEALSGACRTQVSVALERPLPRILGNHHLLCLGDHTAALEAAVSLAGFTLL